MVSDRKAKILADPGFYYLSVLVDNHGDRIDGGGYDAVYIDSALKSKYSRTMWDTQAWNTLMWNCSVLRKQIVPKLPITSSRTGEAREAYIQFNTIEELNAFAGTDFSPAPNEGK